MLLEGCERRLRFRLRLELSLGLQTPSLPCLRACFFARSLHIPGIILLVFYNPTRLLFSPANILRLTLRIQPIHASSTLRLFWIANRYQVSCVRCSILLILAVSRLLPVLRIGCDNARTAVVRVLFSQEYGRILQVVGCCDAIRTAAALALLMVLRPRVCTAGAAATDRRSSDACYYSSCCWCCCYF